MHHDTAEEKIHIEVVQDVGPALERAKAMRNDDELKKRGIKQGWMHAALLPDGVVHKWMNEKAHPACVPLQRGARGDHEDPSNRSGLPIPENG